jgi:hypothetical protein
MKYCILRFRSDTFKNAEPAVTVFLEQKDGSIKKFGPAPGEDMEFAEWYARVQKGTGGFKNAQFNDFTTGYTYWNRWNGEYEGDDKALVDNALQDIIGNVGIYGKHPYSGNGKKRGY